MMQREDLNFYLQKAHDKARAELCRKVSDTALVRVIQHPTVQTLMLPVADPISGGSFYAGEVLVTSAIIRVNHSEGWAMIMDEQPDLAHQVALLDGAYDADICRREILSLAGEGKFNHEQENLRLAADVRKTRVSFDLM